MIEELKTKISRRLYEYSKHAVDQSLIRRIGVHEVEEAFRNQCEIIEDYPDDKYGPSCLILGFTGLNRPIHVHCSYPMRDLVTIVTIYEPNPAFWIDNRERR